MLDIAKIATFRRTVEVNVPDGDGFAKASLVATFRVIASDVAEKFNFYLDKEIGDFLRAVIVRLDDVESDGVAQEYSEILRDQVIALPYVRVALSRCYFAEVASAKAGN